MNAEDKKKAPGFEEGQVEELRKAIGRCKFALDRGLLTSARDRCAVGCPEWRRCQYHLDSLDNHERMCRRIKRYLSKPIEKMQDLHREMVVADDPSSSMALLPKVMGASLVSACSADTMTGEAFTLAHIEELLEDVTVFKEMVKVKEHLTLMLLTAEEKKKARPKRPAPSPASPAPPPKQQRPSTSTTPPASLVKSPPPPKNDNSGQSASTSTTPPSSLVKPPSTPRNKNSGQRGRKAKTGSKGKRAVNETTKRDRDFIERLLEMEKTGNIEVEECHSVDDLAEKYRNGAIFRIEGDMGIYPSNQPGIGDMDQWHEALAKSARNKTLAKCLKDIGAGEQHEVKIPRKDKGKIYNLPDFFEENSILSQLEKQPKSSVKQEQNRLKNYLEKSREIDPFLLVSSQNSFDEIKLPLYGAGTVVYVCRGEKTFYIGAIQDHKEVCFEESREECFQEEIFSKLTEVVVPCGETLVIKPGHFYCSINTENSVVFGYHYLSTDDIDFYLRWVNAAESDALEYNVSKWLPADFLYMVTFYIDRVLIGKLQNGPLGEIEAAFELGEKFAEELPEEHNVFKSKRSQAVMRRLFEAIGRPDDFLLKYNNDNKVVGNGEEEEEEKEEEQHGEEDAEEERNGEEEEEGVMNEEIDDDETLMEKDEVAVNQTNNQEVDSTSSIGEKEGNGTASQEGVPSDTQPTRQGEENGNDAESQEIEASVNQEINQDITDEVEVPAPSQEGELSADH